MQARVLRTKGFLRIFSKNFLKQRDLCQRCTKLFGSEMFQRSTYQCFSWNGQLYQQLLTAFASYLAYSLSFSCSKFTKPRQNWRHSGIKFSPWKQWQTLPFFRNFANSSYLYPSRFPNFNFQWSHSFIFKHKTQTSFHKLPPCSLGPLNQFPQRWTRKRWPQMYTDISSPETCSFNSLVSILRYCQQRKVAKYSIGKHTF